MNDNLKKWFNSLASKKDSIEKKPDEFDAKKLVNIYSIKTPYGKRFAPRETFNIGRLDSENISPPYVIKVCSSNILHKTELQGVVLNSDRENVKNNFGKMQKRFPNENILVENQTDFKGPEFIIGIIKDPALGHAIMVGAGGVLTEIYKDISFRLAPCSENEAMDMIDELVLSPIFDNFRGMALDKKKLAEIISQVSKLANDFEDNLNQLDINPIVFSGGQWIALDVKIVFD